MAADFTVAMMALAIGWAVFMPLLTHLSMRLDGYAPATPASSLTGYNVHV